MSAPLIIRLACGVSDFIELCIPLPRPDDLRIGVGDDAGVGDPGRPTICGRAIIVCIGIDARPAITRIDALVGRVETGVALKAVDERIVARVESAEIRLADLFGIWIGPVDVNPRPSAAALTAARPSPADGGVGDPGRPASIRSAWSSSTRRGSRPTWHRCGGGHQKANACVASRRTAAGAR